MNSHNAYRAALLLAATAVLGIGSAAPAGASSPWTECGVTAATCERTGHSPMSPGTADPAKQQLLYGPMGQPMPIPIQPSTG